MQQLNNVVNGFLKEEDIYKRSNEGKVGYSLPACDVPKKKPSKFIRSVSANLPSVSEVDVVRHFTRLSNYNYGVDTGFYPLGSCTMKYNPKFNEKIANMQEFNSLNPYQPIQTIQSALYVVKSVEKYLAEISGFDYVTMQPAAGAHGEFTGISLIRAYLKDKGNPRKIILIPDSAHGTNPASSALRGYQVKTVKSNEQGILDPSVIEKEMNEDVAAIMITNPNTLGLFEENIKKIADIVHEKGGLLYCDGANFNAIMGYTRPGDFGVDVLQFNLHKTFSTPHGGGGPGSGPVGIKKELEPYMPIPIINCNENGFYDLNYNHPKSIGKIKGFLGQFNVILKAFVYFHTMGAEGLKKVSETAVLNANYIRKRLDGIYNIPFNKLCMHECVLSDKKQHERGVTTLDIAKKLIDYGFHPPTVYFPLIVEGAIMIEPTETEGLKELDEFINTMIKINEDVLNEPDKLHAAPIRTYIGRPDEVKAVKEQKLKI